MTGKKKIFTALILMVIAALSFAACGEPDVGLRPRERRETTAERDDDRTPPRETTAEQNDDRTSPRETTAERNDDRTSPRETPSGGFAEHIEEARNTSTEESEIEIEPPITESDYIEIIEESPLSGSTYEMPVATGWTVTENNLIDMVFLMAVAPDGGTNISIATENTQGMSESSYIEATISTIKLMYNVSISDRFEVIIDGVSGTRLDYNLSGMNISQYIVIRNGLAHVITYTKASNAYDADVDAMINGFRFK